ncbi:argininosuccinate lyase [Fusarium agapanthi]|uniref:Argininosuccinate lyase n=1 Tax=Fusarium agapanthi TaxID=1803897 RepID=A0A9P5EFE2_9HYPO|nr:argininosuccinate lyase [Fusarium agapanthi]
MNDLMVTFNESLPFDKALHEADVRGSITFAKAPRQLDLLIDEELSEITRGLEAVKKDRLSEDLIIYSTAEFGFIQVADEYSTGSSLMPQKKNPDSLELIRGKAGRVMGQASGFISTLKSLPTAYNKDIQESVEPLLDCVKTINSKKMKAALTADMLATDVADYLVVKGVPFRQTHHIAGAVVRKAEEKGVSIAELKLPDLKQISPQFEADIVDVFDFERSVERRTAQGGTSRSSVLSQISVIEAYLAGN